MTLLPPGVKVHLAFGYIDMRKGIDGLAMLVQGVLRQDPFCCVDRLSRHPVSGHSSIRSACLKGAMNGLMHRSKQRSIGGGSRATDQR
jgi:hypothetical protein